MVAIQCGKNLVETRLQHNRVTYITRQLDDRVSKQEHAPIQFGNRDILLFFLLNRGKSPFSPTFFFFFFLSPLHLLTFIDLYLKYTQNNSSLLFSILLVFASLKILFYPSFVANYYRIHCKPQIQHLGPHFFSLLCLFII